VQKAGQPYQGEKGKNVKKKKEKILKERVLNEESVRPAQGKCRQGKGKKKASETARPNKSAWDERHKKLLRKVRGVRSKKKFSNNKKKTTGWDARGSREKEYD